MLIIREAQFEVFRRQMDRALIVRLTGLLREEFPDRFSDPEEARKQAELTVREADKAAIESPDSIMELARLIIRFGNDLEGFPDPAWAAAILAHTQLDGDLKIEFLRQRLEEPIETSDEED